MYHHHITRQLAEAQTADGQRTKPAARRPHRLVSATAFQRSPSRSPQ